jgi:hypothetical protein
MNFRIFQKSAVRLCEFSSTRFVCASSVRRGSFVRLQFDAVRLCDFSSTRFVCASSVRRGSFVRLQFDEVRLCDFSSTRFVCATSVRASFHLCDFVPSNSHIRTNSELIVEVSSSSNSDVRLLSSHVRLQFVCATLVYNSSFVRL